MGKGKRIRNSKKSTSDFEPFGLVMANDGQGNGFIFDGNGHLKTAVSHGGEVFTNSVNSLNLTPRERKIFDKGQSYGFTQLAWLQYLDHGDTTGIQTCKDYAGSGETLQPFVEQVLNDTVPFPWTDEAAEYYEKKKREFRDLISVGEA